MKIFSTATAAALILGATAIMHSTPASAQLPLGTCQELSEECTQGDQQACKIYLIGCKGKSQMGSAAGDMPLAKSNDSK